MTANIVNLLTLGPILYPLIVTIIADCIRACLKKKCR